MIYFLLGLVLGGVVGVFTMALCAVSKEGIPESERAKIFSEGWGEAWRLAHQKDDLDLERARAANVQWLANIKNLSAQADRLIRETGGTP